jgi:xylulokinase
VVKYSRGGIVSDTRASSLLLGVDVGSSDCKALLITMEGGIIASASQPYPTHYPRAGWAEQHPQDWYAAACTAIRACLEVATVRPDAIAALAVDGPAHNVALLDTAGEVVRPTLHWSDLRSAPQAERLEAQMGEAIFATTYSRVNPSWTLTQLLWLRENEPQTWARLHRILVTKDYVRYRFTGNYVTDPYDAVGTQLYDVAASSWSDELLRLLERGSDWLPRVCGAGEIAGLLHRSAADDTGLAVGTPVIVGSGDSVVEAFGIGALEGGACIVKLGTSANVNLVTTQPLPSRQSITYPHVAPERWFSITATNSGASTMRWFRDTFCRLEVEQARQQEMSVYALIDQLAEDAPAGAEGLLFHPYLMGERSPYWDPHLRGDFVGITALHNVHHFARAILEGVAYSIRDCLQVVQVLGQPITHISLIGGGAKSRVWRTVLCDVLGVALTKPAIEDAAFGSALLAGVGIGIYPTMADAARQCVRGGETLLPNATHQERYNDTFEVYRAITRDLAKYSYRLGELSSKYDTPNPQPLEERP